MDEAKVESQELQTVAPAFFARTYCPDVLNGLQTAEELRDVNGYEAEKKTTVITLD